MKKNTIQKSVLIASIAGLYLTAIYFYFSLKSIEFAGFSILIYYIFNCFLLLIIYFFLRGNMILSAKMASSLLLISVLASLFLDLGYLSNNLFMSSVLGAVALGGLGIPFVGAIPLILFFWGVIMSLILILKKNLSDTLS